MDSPHLTDEEVAHATYPLTQGAARVRFFRDLGCKVATRPNGHPQVAGSSPARGANNQQVANARPATASQNIHQW